MKKTERHRAEHLPDAMTWISGRHHELISEIAAAEDITVFQALAGIIRAELCRRQNKTTPDRSGLSDERQEIVLGSSKTGAPDPVDPRRLVTADGPATLTEEGRQ